MNRFESANDCVFSAPIPPVDVLPLRRKGRVASFDVFDTVLTRTWARPVHLFHVLGEVLAERGLTALSPNRWAEARISAESRLRKEGRGQGEITLLQIYARLETVFVSRHSMQTAQALEIELEIESHRPVPQILEEISVCRKINCHIVFISDMYLPAESIRRSLINHGIWREDDRLFVSSEIGETKASGKLFHCVQSELAVSFASWQHAGDNCLADCAAPARLGIDAAHFDKAILSRYEAEIADRTDLPLQFRSSLAGSMRLARLNGTLVGKHAVTIAETAADVIGPVLLAFVAWCMARAKAKGIKRLYFIARDGQLPHAISRLLDRHLGQDIECRYLYGSRQAWRSAAIGVSGGFELELAFEAESLTFREVAQQICLDAPTLAGLSRGLSAARAPWNRTLSPAERVELRQHIEQAEVMRVVAQRAIAQRQLVQEYFRQEGLTDGVPFAFVDVGWRGTLQRAASLILADAGVRPPSGTMGLYFGLSSRNPAFPDDRMEAFFHDAEASGMNRHRLCNGPLLEQFTEADHGTVTGFVRQTDGRIAPVLKETANMLAMAWGLRVQQQAVLGFVNTWLQSAKPGFVLGEEQIWRTVAATLLDRFISMPRVSEAAAFGSFPKTNGQSHDDHQELAPRYSARTSFLVSLFGSRGLGSLPNHAGLWPQASMRRAGHDVCIRIMDMRMRLIDAVRSGRWIRSAKP